MNYHSVTLPVPDDIYDCARRIAAGTSQSIEAVLLQQLQDAFASPLPALAPEEQRELEALTFPSDDAMNPDTVIVGIGASSGSPRILQRSCAPTARKPRMRQRMATQRRPCDTLLIGGDEF